MSKAGKDKMDDDLRTEYDFSSMSGAVRGKYYQRHRAGLPCAAGARSGEGLPH
jgi:hypothetical protein